MSNHALIVAAGQGRRFGQEKQFTLIHDRPVLIHTLLVFQKCSVIDTITLVVPRPRIAFTKQLTKKWGITKLRHVIAGGRRRQDSVQNALKRMKAQTGIIIVHDGVRPCLTPALVRRGINLCQRHRAVITGRPVSETIKEVKKNRVIKTVPRRNLYLIQTPQFFDIALLKKAYAKADGAREYTDEAAVLEALGIPVYHLLGDAMNIKITRPKDLELCRKIIV